MEEREESVPGTYMLPLFYDEEFLGVLNVRRVS